MQTENKSINTLFRAIEVERQQTHGDSVFPLVMAPQSSLTMDRLAQWINESRQRICQLATQHGAVLFTGFPMVAVEDFDTFVQSLEIPNFPYRKSLSNAVRVNRTERVFSANEAPPDVQIFFHHEMAQTPLFPEWIMFYCEVAPETGGATPLCRSDALYERLAAERPQFVAACEAKGLKYTNVMPGDDDPLSGMGRSWRSTLGVSSKEEAESRLQELNYTWQWRQDGCLKATTAPLPAVMEVSPGRKTFFNQLIAAYSGWKDSRNDPSDAIRHGDGTKLDADSVKRAIELADELAFDVHWKKGDAVLIDNRIVMHARRPFAGTRKVVASLGNMQTQSFALP